MGTTQQDRFKAAIKAIRARGVRFVQNVGQKQYDERLGMTEEQEKATPYAWTDGRQGSNYTWRDDRPAMVSPRGKHQLRVQPLRQLFVNHSNGAGQIVAEEFRAQGFTVEWDGTDMRSVVLVFEEVNTYDVWR